MTYSLTKGGSTDAETHTPVMLLSELPIARTLSRGMVIMGGIIGLLILSAFLLGQGQCRDMIAYVLFNEGDNLVLSCLDNPFHVYALIERGFGRIQHPAWSPDGAQLVFTAIRQDSGTTLYRIDADGRNLRQLTPAAYQQYKTPTWSPDGQHIAFSANRNLYIMNADGSDIRQMNRVGFPGVAPQWSPNGNTLALIPNNHRIDLYDMNTADIQQIPLNVALIGDNEAAFARLAWSPDGQSLVFAAAAETTTHIYIVNARDSHIRQITQADSEMCITPTWSPHGQRLLFACFHVGHEFTGALYVADAHGENLSQLTEMNTMMLYPAWRP